MRIGESSGHALRLSTEAPSSPALPARVSAPASATPPPSTEPSPFAKLVRSLGREVDRGEATVQRALAPGKSEMAPSDLLALQAGIYRYSEAVDLSAKLVDRATSGLRTVLQGQQ